MASSGNINRGIQLIIDVIDVERKISARNVIRTPCETTLLANAIINSSVR